MNMTKTITVTWADVASLAADIGAKLDARDHAITYGRSTYLPIDTLDARAFLLGIETGQDA